MKSATLVLFPGALGDFVCFYPALAFLLGRAPAGSVEVRFRPDLAGLLRADQASVITRPLDSSEVRSLFVAGAHADGTLQAFFDRFAEIYSWTGFRDDTFRQNITALAPGRTHLFPFRPETSSGPMKDYYLSCVGGLSPGGDRALRLSVTPEARAWVGAFAKERGISRLPLLALAPGSGAAKKNWPFEHFAAVSEWWWTQEKGRSLLIAGPVERERWRDATLSCPGGLDAGDLSLGQLAALFCGCCAMVGNDSGTTHLAAAVGTPTFALFGPTDPEQWTPWGASVTVVAAGLNGSPSGTVRRESRSRRGSLADLKPEILIALLERRLNRGHLDKRDFRYFNESGRLFESVASAG